MSFDTVKQLNALIGLTKRIVGWPSTFADLEYTLDRIELELKKPDPSQPGVSIKINPDALLIADKRNFSIIAELKSGTHQDFQQLDRFCAITPKELVQYGRMTLSDPTMLATHGTSVVQFINGDFLNQHLSEFQRVNHQACLVTLDTNPIRSHHGTFADDKERRRRDLPYSKERVMAQYEMKDQEDF